MFAAWESSLETIDVLLRLGADPNILNVKFNSALWFALDSNNLATVKKLLPVSNKGLDGVFNKFPTSSILFSEEIKSFIRKKLDGEPSSMLTGLKSSSEFGHVPMLVVIKDFLTEKFNLDGAHGNMLNTVRIYFEEKIYKNKSKIKAILPKIIENAIDSDKFEACLIVKDICKLLNYNIQDSHYEEARKRKNRKIINLFSNPQQQNVHDIFSESNKDVSILDKMPKTVDIPYKDEMEKIQNLILENESPDGILTYDRLLEKLHVKEVHYKENCTEVCLQKEKCQAVRESVELIKFLLKKMSEDHDPIFKNTEVVIVGSLKEQSKINDVDEASFPKKSKICDIVHKKVGKKP